MTDRVRLDDMTSDQLDALYNSRDRLAALLDAESRTLAEVDARCDRYAAALDRVRRLHQPVHVGDKPAHCQVCTEDYGRRHAPWPCDTVRALDGTVAHPDDTTGGA